MAAWRCGHLVWSRSYGTDGQTFDTWHLVCSVLCTTYDLRPPRLTQPIRTCLVVWSPIGSIIHLPFTWFFGSCCWAVRICFSPSLLSTAIVVERLPPSSSLLVILKVRHKRSSFQTFVYPTFQEPDVCIGTVKFLISRSISLCNPLRQSLWIWQTS